MNPHLQGTWQAESQYMQIYLLEWIIVCALAHPTMPISNRKVKNWMFVQSMRLDASASLLYNSTPQRNRF